jgi:hypothetical protein
MGTGTVLVLQTIRIQFLQKKVFKTISFLSTLNPHKNGLFVAPMQNGLKYKVSLQWLLSSWSKNFKLRTLTKCQSLNSLLTVNKRYIQLLLFWFHFLDLLIKFLKMMLVPLMLFSAVKWIGACSEDAVYEGWEPVPGTRTPGSVLNVHWVQAVCDPRENSGSRQGQQRALSTRVSCRCLDMHCITTVMQYCYITRK